MKTTKQMTSSLSGIALEYAAAKAAKIRLVTDTSGEIALAANGRTMIADMGWTHWQPLVDWSQTGPIIEQEGIYLMPGSGTAKASIIEWDARIDDPEGELWEAAGTTPLEAALRCYVYSKLGNEVSIPDCLIN